MRPLPRRQKPPQRTGPPVSVASFSYAPPRIRALSSLPTEVLTNIVANFGRPEGFLDHFATYYYPDRSLCRLARTCKRLWDICVPKIYEICDLETGHFSKRKLNLFRTLAAKPELARLVKQVIIDNLFSLGPHSDRGIDDPVITADDAVTWNRILEEKMDMTTVKPLREVCLTDLDDGAELWILGSSMSCLALALVPNVVSVVYNTENITIGTFKPGSFPSLRSLAVHQEDTREGGHCECVHGVLGAAPNISIFAGYFVSEVPRASYPSITRVALLYSRLDDGEAARLPNAFPNLESLTYMHSNVYERDSVSPLRLSEMILALKRTLKSVEIQAGIYDDWGQWLPELSEDNCAMKSLAPMMVLKTLRINGLYIYADEYDYHGDSWPKMNLIDLLPASIQNVTVDELSHSRLQDVLALAREAPQRFPELSQVAFPEFEESHQKEVRRAFEERGIACSFEESHVDTLGYEFL